MKPFEIETPCGENWNKMKIGLVSRYCEVCSKDVMDFTQMTREEILEYLFIHQNEKICGRIRTSQLDMSHSELLVTIKSISRKTKNTNLAFYLLSLGSLLFSNCGESQAVKEPIGITCSTDSIKSLGIEKTDSIIPPPSILGNLVYNLPLSVAETMPEFPGGMGSLTQYIHNNLKYPQWEKKNNIQGIVTVSFTINKDGRIFDPEIIKEVKGSKNFNTEVIRLIHSMPDWEPGRNGDEKVDIRYNLNIEFQL